MDIGLKILNEQIERLQKRQAEDKLDFSDIKQLEILLKTRELLMGRPTEIKANEDYSDISDKDVLKYLKVMKRASKTKSKAKSKSSD